MSFIRLSIILLLTATALAQDPPAPPGGFPIQVVADRPILYSDGYRTRLDVRYPTVAPPATGWPCLLVVHGGGGSRQRGWVVAMAERMAEAGYLTLAYDTGNNGITLQINPPGRRLDDRRLTDLAEIVHLAEQNLGPLLDETRLAVMGKSGGGKHALWAAAFSGRPLPVPGYVAAMPTFRAVHTDIQVIDTVSDTLPQDVMIKADFAVSTFENRGPNDPLTQMMLNGNYAGLKAGMVADPVVNLLPLLQQTAVPLLVSYAYDDSKHFVNVNADALPTLMPGLPRRYVQLTGGHGSAGNNGATSLRRDYTRRWCDRFLKGIQNDVEHEPYAEIAILPSDPADYSRVTTDWQHRRTGTWPIAPFRRMFLRSGGQLSGTAPTAMEVGPTIAHRVASSYGMLEFMQDGARPQLVTNRIPLVTQSFDTPPVTEPQEIFGRTIVELDVVNTAPDFQLQAALLDVPPTGAPRFITSGVTAKRQAASGRHRLYIELGDVGYVLRTGHRLRLSLENINLRRQPGNAHFYVAPNFVDVDLTVQIDPTFPPRIDLPIGPARASLTPRIATVSAARGISHDFLIDGESSRAGYAYQLFAGASGNWPGINVGPLPVPLNIDVFTGIAQSATNTVFLQQFAGLLGPDGRATATLALPPQLATATVGLRFSFTALGIDGSGNLFATPPAELLVAP